MVRTVVGKRWPAAGTANAPSARTDPHRNDVKEALLFRIAVRRHEPDWLAGAHGEERRLLLTRGVAGGPFGPLVLGERRLARMGGCERRRIRGQ